MPHLFIMMEKEAVWGKCKLDTVYIPKTRKKMKKTEKSKKFCGKYHRYSEYYV